MNLLPNSSWLNQGLQATFRGAHWQDFYHGEFRGFARVYTTPPDGNLEVQASYSPESWGTPESDSYNYQSGQMTRDDLYWGTVETTGQLIKETVNQYSGNADFLPSGSTAYSGACTSTSVSTVFTPCEVVLVFSKTTLYEQNGTGTSGAPWEQTTYTYDDSSTTHALSPSGYHNVTQEQITSSNAPTVTKKWSYVTSDTTVNTYVYHTVDTVSHSEVDDASGHVWKCTNTTYDEGISGITTPAAGWPTTVKTYSNCASPGASTTFTTYNAYDLVGNTVSTVDAFGAANSGLYANTGCTLATAPVAKASAWTTSRYTTCDVYDGYAAQVSSEQNVLGQTTSTTFDDTQGRLPTSATDENGQPTSVTYSIDSSGNQTMQVKKPGESGSSTTQSSTYTSCTFSSARPCYEIDTLSSQYPGAVSRTFYDSLGQPTETRTPLDATHDLVTFTIYNQWNDSTFVSEPFRVASGSSWIDPNGATDDQGNTPTGTITLTDSLGRVLATRDPIEGTSAEPGISCGSGKLAGTWTTCVTYGLGSPTGSTTLYDDAVSHDANAHQTATFTDALGRSRYVQTYSVSGPITATITSVTQTQYNVLDQPTAVIVTDAAPQSGQSVTSVTTSQTYDDLGRAINLADPDRGTHTYSYDADSRQITDVSGSRTLGTSYDLLGRARCIQDAAPTTDGSGNCSSGSHPLVQTSYDSSSLQLSGTTNYIVGRLGQSVATTYYPDGSSVAATQQFEYDQRGRQIASTLQLSTPSSWNVTTALPSYQQQMSYNDADQPTTMQTTVGGATGYTFTQVYDSTTGMLNGLSNTTTGAANVASLAYGVNGQVSDLNFLATSGSNVVTLANDHFTYDGNLRPASTTATWQSGSGSTGTLFSSSRTYDPAGNVLSLSTTQAVVPGQTGSGGSQTENFCYDEQNRLVWAGNSGTQPAAGNGTCGSATLANTFAGATYSSSYAYTHLGQLWQGPLGGTGSTQQYLYCDSNHPHQLTGVFAAGATCSNQGTASYGTGYDAWGNQTTRNVGGTNATLSYDVLDHLVQWNAGSTNQEWSAYDASGNRVLLRSTSGTGTSITTYPFGLEEHLYGATGSNVGNTYYYALAGRLVGLASGTGTLSTQDLLTDALGSVLATFSATPGTAALLGNQVYGPYGNALYAQGVMGTAKGYTGQYGDSTGLDYYNARYYDPVVRQFLSADTVQGNAQGVDPFAYVAGNPETKNDPTGHCDSICVWMQVTLAFAEIMDPIVAFTAVVSEVNLYITDWSNGQTPTDQEVATTRLRADMNGVLYSIAAIPLIEVGVTGPLGLALGLLALGTGTIMVNQLSSSMDALANQFYKDHPLDQRDQNTPIEQPPTPNTVPRKPEAPHQNVNPPQGSSSSHPTQYLNSFVPPSPLHSSGGAGSYTVVSGDTLWGIAARFYGSGAQWGRIYGANGGVIGSNPNLIYPGERLMIPR